MAPVLPGVAPFHQKAWSSGPLNASPMPTLNWIRKSHPGGGSGLQHHGGLLAWWNDSVKGYLLKMHRVCSMEERPEKNEHVPYNGAFHNMFYIAFI